MRKRIKKFFGNIFSVWLAEGDYDDAKMIYNGVRNRVKKILVRG